ncbi:hypothetical protein Patl1_24441 [Pistacia atlantica]|uniref:Uncharacterized protein n=1 Tax=Pistacia atlantica TaxID=434234 RepID=A0ACC0ZWZ6_9ROSI|nr:hypothetical protein Patl1_24441 [Pistacia atlantica]
MSSPFRSPSTVPPAQPPTVRVVTESVRQLSAKLVSNDVDTLQGDQKLKIVVFDWALGGRDEQVMSQQEERCSAGTQLHKARNLLFYHCDRNGITNFTKDEFVVTFCALRTPDLRA